MFETSTQFSEDWLHFNELLCLQGKAFCLKYETFFQRKSMLISTFRYLSLAVNYVFVDKNSTACGEQNSSKGSQSSLNWCATWKIFNVYRDRFKFAWKNCFEDRQAAIFFIMANWVEVKPSGGQEVSHWRVKLSGVSQSKMLKATLASH